MLIAISQRNDKNKHGDFIDNLENNYVNYLEKFGIKLLIIPNSTKDVFSYFEEPSISGIILSGGNDINPELYGEKRVNGLAVSKERDSIEKKMLEIAIKKKLPVLGICRGMQFINVFFKGKLTNVEGHVAKNHIVKTKDGEFEVNSYHGQGITSKEVSPELKVFAQSGEIIEGIYHPSMLIAGIQWHPERKSPNEKVNRKILKAFLDRKLFWKK